MKKKQSIKLLILSITSIGVISYISGQFTKTSVDTWYTTLKKSSLTPPDITFPIVWSILYLMIALALWQLLKKYKQKKISKAPLIFFGIQMICNFLWSPLFFALQSPLLGLIDIIPLWIFIALTIITSYKGAKEVSLLLIPYFLWVSFAVYLNAVIVYLF